MTDEWTLAELEVLGSLNVTGPASLRSMITVIESRDHTIQDEAGFSAAAGRLIATGLVGSDGTEFWLTEAGTAIRMEQKMWIALQQTGTPHGEPVVLAEGAWDQAYQEHRDELASKPEPGPPTWTDLDVSIFAMTSDGGASDGSPLRMLIAQIDGWERMILTEEEFCTSVGRLIAAGVLATNGEVYWKTEAGLRVRGIRGRNYSRTLIDLRRIGPPHGEPLSLPPGLFDQTVDDYLENFGKPGTKNA